MFKPKLIASFVFFVMITAALFCCADGESAAPLARKNEIKLFVTAANTEQAIKALKLDEHKARKRTVIFFDTGDRSLGANHLILRARQQGKGHGDSTVKLRAPEGEAELSDAERAIQPEQDWTNENEPTVSRSKDRESTRQGPGVKSCCRAGSNNRTIQQRTAGTGNWPHEGFQLGRAATVRPGRG